VRLAQKGADSIILTKRRDVGMKYGRKKEEDSDT
jgi:hypothetical protein